MKNDKLFACTEVNGVELRQKIKVWHAFAVRKTEGLRKSDLVGLKTKKWNTFLPKWNTLPKLMVVASVPHGAGFQQKRGWLW